MKKHRGEGGSEKGRTLEITIDQRVFHVGVMELGFINLRKRTYIRP